MSTRSISQIIHFGESNLFDTYNSSVSFMNILSLLYSFQVTKNEIKF